MGHPMSAPSPDADELTELAHRHLWMHFSRLGCVRRRRAGARHRARRGLLAVGRHRPPAPRRPVGPVHRAGRPRPPRPRRRGAGAGRDARVLPDLDVRAPARDRAGGPPRRARARRPQPGVLHQRRVRGGRVGVEAGAPVLPRHRPGPAPQGDRAAHRVPRHHARARSPSPASPRCARRSNRSRPARCTSPTPTGGVTRSATTRRRSCSRSPTRSRSGSVFEGPETVAAVFLEPVQNAGGCLVPPEGYFARVREICDRYGVLLVSDEVICAFGRLGTMFGCERYDYLPDIITCAKGLTSGYSPLGAVICRDFLAEPFLEDQASFAHGITFGGHPVSCAVGARQPRRVRARSVCSTTCSRTRPASATGSSAARPPDRRRRARRRLLPGARDGARSRVATPASPPSSARSCCAASCSPASTSEGLIARADDRGDPVVQLAPPLSRATTSSTSSPTSCDASSPRRRIASAPDPLARRCPAGSNGG